MLFVFLPVGNMIIARMFMKCRNWIIYLISISLIRFCDFHYFRPQVLPTQLDKNLEFCLHLMRHVIGSNKKLICQVLTRRKLMIA
jgi:hypothetical protein